MKRWNTRRNQINWYKHDTDATQDAKVRKLLIKYGAMGYAIYFHCLELIAAEISETNLTFELEHDSEIIADNLYINGTAEKSGIEIVEEIMKYIISLGLFQESGGKVFCFKLLKRLDLSMTSNPRFREMIVEAKENHDTVMIPSCFHHEVPHASLQAFKPSNKQDNKRPTHTPDKPKKVKKTYAPLVTLTEEEYSAIITKHTKDVVDEAIEYLSDYKEANGKRYKSDAGALRQWGIQAIYERRAKHPKVEKGVINGMQATDKACGYCGSKIIGTMTNCMRCGWAVGDNVEENRDWYEAQIKRHTEGKK